MNIQDPVSQFRANIPAGHFAIRFSPWEQFRKSSRERRQKYLSYSNRTPSALSLRREYWSNRVLSSPLPLSHSLCLLFFLRGRITLLSTDKPRWKTWHSLSATIYSIFAKLAKSLPGKPTDQPDVLSFLASLAKER